MVLNYLFFPEFPKIQQFLAYLALEKPIEFFYKCKKIFLDENVYIKNSNFGPKLDAENSGKIGFGGTEGSQIWV